MQEWLQRLKDEAEEASQYLEVIESKVIKLQAYEMDNVNSANPGGALRIAQANAMGDVIQTLRVYLDVLYKRHRLYGLPVPKRYQSPT